MQVDPAPLLCLVGRAPVWKYTDCFLSRLELELVPSVQTLAWVDGWIHGWMVLYDWSKASKSLKSKDAELHNMGWICVLEWSTTAGCL